ncbi:MAG TPA: hypothetical protein VFQ39_05490 [Longimicrobium sp.]|nr:hypothetical protein [Longimicrobium sp.]
MKKLRLSLEGLSVESFPTMRTEAPSGTVRAYVTRAAQGCVRSDYPTDCPDSSIYASCGCGGTGTGSNPPGTGPYLFCTYNCPPADTV